MGNRFPSMVDLAPDDIAGVSFIYPRGSQAGFFGIFEQARTHAADTAPAYPLPGGHVVAWCDADDLPDTPRVPLISTMTGLFVAGNEPVRAGRFNLEGLLKEIETMGLQAPVEATYTVTINPLDGAGIEFQSPGGYGPEDFDSMHQGSDSHTFNINFQPEVFHETRNMLQLDRRDLGTPLLYDARRNKIASATSDKTLDVILAGLRPMFGSRGMCPLLVGSIGLKTAHAPNALRRFRDEYLLNTALGAAFVTAYYEAAPALARQLLEHKGLWTMVHSLLAAVEWCADHCLLIPFLIAAGALAVIAYCRKRARTAALSLMLLCAAGLLSSPAGASILYMTELDMIAQADYIIEANVVNVDCHYTGNRIVTDVELGVADVLKGRVNKQAAMFLTLPGGRVGHVVTYCPEMPAFTQGERVLLYLVQSEGGDLKVLAGKRGKYEIVSDGKTGEAHVQGGAIPASGDGKAAPKPMPADASAKERPAPPALDKFKAFVRDTVKKQDADER